MAFSSKSILAIAAVLIAGAAAYVWYQEVNRESGASAEQAALDEAERERAYALLNPTDCVDGKKYFALKRGPVMGFNLDVAVTSASTPSPEDSYKRHRASCSPDEIVNSVDFLAFLLPSPQALDAEMALRGRKILVTLYSTVTPSRTLMPEWKPPYIEMVGRFRRCAREHGQRGLPGGLLRCPADAREHSREAKVIYLAPDDVYSDAVERYFHFCRSGGEAETLCHSTGLIADGRVRFSYHTINTPDFTALREDQLIDFDRTVRAMIAASVVR